MSDEDGSYDDDMREQREEEYRYRMADLDWRQGISPTAVPDNEEEEE